MKKIYLFLIITTLSSFSTYLFLKITKINEQFFENNITIKFLESNYNLFNVISKRESFVYFSNNKLSMTAYSNLVDTIVTENLCNRNANEQLKPIQVNWNKSINFKIFFLEQEKIEICLKKIKKILDKLDVMFLNTVDEYINISNNNRIIKNADEEILINNLKKLKNNQQKKFYRIASRIKKIEGGINIILSVFFLFNLFYFVFYRMSKKINFIK